MKRSHPMEQQNNTCDCDTGSKHIDPPEQYDGCTNDKEDCTYFKKKRLKICTYIKESYRSLKQWFNGSIDTKSNNGNHCSQAWNVKIGIKHKSKEMYNDGDNNLDVKEGAKIDENLMESARETIDKLNISREDVYIRIDHTPKNRISKGTWGSNSFLLNSSKSLLPRRKNGGDTLRTHDVMRTPTNPLDSFLKPILPKKGINNSKSLSTSIAIMNGENKVLQPLSPLKLDKKIYKSTEIDITQEYFMEKLRALRAITSNRYHEKEKEYIIQQIKANQAKRKHIKEQYESLFADSLFLPKTKLPQLDQNMLEKYLECIRNKSTNGFNITLPTSAITCEDISTLLGLNWLNDEVINFYMGLIIGRAKTCNQYPSVYAFNTFFYDKLTRAGYEGVRRWTKKINLFDNRFVLIPIHLAVHWCMCIVDMAEYTIKYYDSLMTPNYECVNRIKNYLMEEHKNRLSKPLNLIGWKFDCPKNIPTQSNGSDCGVFSCVFGEYISRCASFDFTQDDMPYFRQKMIYEIFQNRLLM